jgi:hypothetical protein
MDRIPILQMGDTLLVTIQVDMQDQTALALQDDLANKIAATGAKGVLIDISALEIVDSFVGAHAGQHLGHRAHPRRHHGGGGHAAGRGHHAGRAGLSLEGVRPRSTWSAAWSFSALAAGERLGH